jgi:hypothetical protein
LYVNAIPNKLPMQRAAEITANTPAVIAAADPEIKMPATLVLFEGLDESRAAAAKNTSPPLTRQIPQKIQNVAKKAITTNLGQLQSWRQLQSIVCALSPENSRKRQPAGARTGRLITTAPTKPRLADANQPTPTATTYKMILQSKRPQLTTQQPVS